MVKIAALFVLSLLLSACAGVERNAMPSWQAPMNQTHPLVGSIWNVREERSVTVQALLQSLSQTRYVLLGEKHDNPDHHQLQAYVLQQLSGEASLASVSFEMLDSSQDALLLKISNDVLGSMDALKVHLNWDDEGWNWEYYGPMLYDLLRSGISVRTANISSDELMSIYGGEDSDAIKGILGASQLERLEREIDESHCGMLPQSQFGSMVRVQRSRDAQMAASLQRGAGANQGANVLLAGNFHARRDLGVPNYIADNEALLSIAFIELSDESGDPREYAADLGPGLPYDYLWFTPAVETQDYCAQLRANAEQ